MYCRIYDMVNRIIERHPILCMVIASILMAELMLWIIRTTFAM